jgi:hypothetical protein
VIEPSDAPQEAPPPNIATIAFLGLVAGLVLWLGGACLVLGSGGEGGLPSKLPAQNVSTPRSATATATRPADRTDCAAIRGTDYRSEAERQWFLANCR